MSFKDDVRDDIRDTMLDMDEFAEVHMIDGREMSAVVDEIDSMYRNRSLSSRADGFYKKRFILAVSAEDFGELPAADRILLLDRKNYLVKEAHNEMGMYLITLEVARA